MNDKKKLQRKLDRMGKKKGNTADVSDTRKEINEFIQDNGRPGQKRRAQKLNDKINPSYQGIAPIKGMTDAEARSIDEDTYPDGPSRKSPINHQIAHKHSDGSKHGYIKPGVARKSALNMLGISSPLDKRGLWDNIHAKRKRGEAPNKPGDKGYPTDKALRDSQ